MTHTTSGPPVNLPAIFGGYDVHILLPKYCWHKHIPTFLFYTYQPKVVTLFARKVIANFRFYYIHFEITGDPCNLLALIDVIYSQITSFPLNHIFFKPRHSCFKTAPFLVWIPGGGYSIYPWVGRCGLAPHTLILFKTKISDLRQCSDFWYPV